MKKSTAAIAKALAGALLLLVSACSKKQQGILFRWTMLKQDRSMPQASDQQGTQTFGTMALFLNGKLAMFHSGIWKTPTFRNIKDFKWDVVRFPTRKGAKAPKYLSGGSGYAMRSDVAMPEACWKLIKFLAGPEGQKRMAATGLAQPAIKSLAASKVFLDDQDPRNKKMLLYAAEHGLASPAWKPWRQLVRDTWGAGHGSLLAAGVQWRAGRGAQDGGGSRAEGQRQGG